MEELEKSIIKTGTTTVGIICKEGIVMAADKRSTADFFIANKESVKVFKITDNIAVTVAGVVSDIQLILKLTKAELKLKSVRTKMLPTVREAANLFASIVYQNIRKFSPIMGISSFIIGGKDSTGFSMYVIGVDGSIQDCSNYVTTGAYGSFIAYGILENEWKPTLTIEEGRKMALKVIFTAIKRDASVGEGAHIVIIDEKGVGDIKDEKYEK